jgi:hypothetical protein
LIVTAGSAEYDDRVAGWPDSRRACVATMRAAGECSLLHQGASMAAGRGHTRAPDDRWLHAKAEWPD